ncbi:hypothetical protein BKA66DRAFT_472907 [Pyrenochaeta sp. MPI-SDFR-AT-0127]|nr:hypothetical protein BKA66DRAFT_472907 [Pyrenochaeta sp. MPI-SDFR-AT-0127]
MPDQQYAGERYSRSHNRGHRSLSSYDQLSHGYDQSASYSSDYISRHKSSDQDYIPRQRQPRHDSCIAPRDDGFRSGNSDYISRPPEDRGDYISHDPHEKPFYSDTNSSFGLSRQESSLFSPASSFSSPVHEDRSPLHFTRSYSSPNTSTQEDRSYERSNYQLIKDGGWDHQHDFMRSHGLKPWKDEDYEIANGILDKYREVDAQTAYKPDRRYHARVSSVDSTEDTSDYEAKVISAHDSDIASYHGSSPSDIVSRGASSVGSDICSIPSSRRVSAHKRGHSSSRSDIAPNTPSGSDDGFSDEDDISDSSDYMSKDDDRRSVTSKQEASDDGYGEDYMDDGEGGYIEDDVYDDDDDY